MRRFAVVWVLALVLGACGGVKELPPGGLPDGDGAVDGTELPETGETAAAPSDAAEVFAAARGAFHVGECERAIELYDQLLADTDWVDSSPLVDVVWIERDDCAAFLTIGATAADDSDLIAGYEGFVDERPDSGLVPIVFAELERLAGGGDGEPTEPAAATPTTAPEPVALVPNLELCADLADFRDIDGAAAGSPEQADLYFGCMQLASTEENADLLAALQLSFLVDQAGHAEAARVRTELAANFGACDRLDQVRVLADRTEGSTLWLDTLFTCAGFADFVGDVEGAIDYYEQIRSEGVEGERAVQAEAGLARNLIAQARAAGADQLLDIARIGSSGSGMAQLSFSNDTAYEQTLVLSGPEGRIIVIEASPTSSAYLTRPSSCREDVPKITLDLTPGTYDVLLSDQIVDAEVATWNLTSGSAYGWCSFYVRAF